MLRPRGSRRDSHERMLSHLIHHHPLPPSPSLLRLRSSCLSVLRALRIVNEAGAVDLEQARVIENVDHYLHALLLLQEGNEEMVVDQSVLVKALMRRIADNSGRKRQKGGDVGLPVMLTASRDRGEEGDAVVNNVEYQVQRDVAVRRIRTLQLMMIKAGGRGAVDLAFQGEKTKLLQTATGPCEFVGTPCSLSKGTSLSGPRHLGHANAMVSGSGSAMVMMAVNGASTSNGSSSLQDDSISSALTLKRYTSASVHDSGASPEAFKYLMYGYEVDLKTQPIDFLEIAAQFELWNGQDSELGVSGRATPRPSPSPTPDGSTWPSPIPTPPLPSVGTYTLAGTANSLMVKVPHWSLATNRLDLKALAVSNLSSVEIEEEKSLKNDALLIKHDTSLDEFRVRFEAEQDVRKIKKKQAVEARENATRVVLMAATKSNKHAAAAAAAHGANGHHKSR